ncbi:hypothetical protein LZ554_009494 [Drepanopeziza brunnea f. sp. 'monogermtubi']|nr:hypothetical protein LZ554_009494 [Drepanopeziza brunnea f. sp. 'monogermtubi']
MSLPEPQGCGHEAVVPTGMSRFGSRNSAFRPSTWQIRTQGFSLDCKSHSHYLIVFDCCSHSATKISSSPP